MSATSSPDATASVPAQRRPSVEPAGTSTLLRRLQAIDRYDLFHPGLRDELSALCRRSAERFGTELGGVMLVLGSVPYAVSQHGTSGWLPDAGGLPVEWSFCETPVRTARPYVVTDATQDPRHRTDPRVARDGVRCYAGAPLTGPGGATLGAHCVVGRRSRGFTPDEVRWLQAAARDVMGVLDRYRRG